jgi:hypothetical protein
MNDRVGIWAEPSADPYRHLAAARRRVSLNLTRVLVIPAGRRASPCSPSRRCPSIAMVALAIASRPAYQVSDRGERTGAVMLAHPPPAARGGLRASDLFFIPRADAFATSPPGTLPRHPGRCHYVVVTRGPRTGARSSAEQDRHAGGAGRLIGRAYPAIDPLIGAITPDVSSSRIRRLLSEGAAVHGMLPAVEMRTAGLRDRTTCALDIRRPRYPRMTSWQRPKLSRACRPTSGRRLVRRDKLAVDVVVLDLRKVTRSPITSNLPGAQPRQIKPLPTPFRSTPTPLRFGNTIRQWVLLDYFDFVVHTHARGRAT